ncbi:MAG: hypothetical protein WC516_05365 [Patescibacteria group bacterium]|jgi:hypothetical protein
MKKKKKKFTKVQLEILFECWKNGNNTKEWLDQITKQLPKVPPLIALSIMRSLVKTNTEWQKIAKRKKNKKEKEKLDKKAESEKKKTVAIQKKQEIERKRTERNKIKEQKEKIKNIKQNLKTEDTKNLLENIEVEYLFCSDVDQYINNISCIFRLFSNEYSILLDTKCEKCIKMNKYIPVLEETINAKSEKTRRYRTSENGSKTKEEDSTITERTNKSAGDS